MNSKEKYFEQSNFKRKIYFNDEKADDKTCNTSSSKIVKKLEKQKSKYE